MSNLEDYKASAAAGLWHQRQQRNQADSPTLCSPGQHFSLFHRASTATMCHICEHGVSVNMMTTSMTLETITKCTACKKHQKQSVGYWQDSQNLKIPAKQEIEWNTEKREQNSENTESITHSLIHFQLIACSYKATVSHILSAHPLHCIVLHQQWVCAAFFVYSFHVYWTVQKNKPLDKTRHPFNRTFPGQPA